MNKTVRNPGFPLYAETRQAIVTKLIVRPKQGKAPSWYDLFHPSANVPAIIRTAPDPTQATGTKLDNVLPAMNEVIAEIAGKPGMKKRAELLQHLLTRGAVAVGQEKETTDRKLDMIMTKLGISYGPRDSDRYSNAILK